MPGSIEHHSTIVIGSGFGGAVAASTLTEAGESVLLLERGPWRDTDATSGADCCTVSASAGFPARA